MEASFTLAADPRSVAAARRAVRSALAERAVDADVVDTAVLLTSELVTNAVLHGGQQVMVSVEPASPRVRIEVEDDGSGTDLPELQAPDPSAVSGRGLQMVARAASDWGVRAEPERTVVWFELPVALPGRPRAATHPIG